MHQKQINYLLLFSFFFLLMPNGVFAGEGMSGKGKLHIKTDSIYEENNDSEGLYETELDKVLPELFHEEIQEKLDAVQNKKHHSMIEIRKQAFTEDIHSTSLYDVKDELFTKNYETSLANVKEDEEATTHLASTVLFYGSVAAFIGIIITVVIVIGRKLDF